MVLALTQNVIIVIIIQYRLSSFNIIRSVALIFVDKGPLTNYVDKILAFFDRLPPCVDIFFGMNYERSL